jgi:anti-sigma factor RsiW
VDHDEFRTKLSAYNDGELPADLMKKIGLHLESCAACRREIEELNRIDFLIRELPQLDVSEQFASQVSAVIMPVAETGPTSLASFARRIFTGFLELAEVIFEMLPGHEYRKTAVLDEFSDFPPLSLSHAYFQVIGR